MPEKYPITERAADDVRNRFVHHPPHGDQAERYAEVRERLRLTAEFVLARTPPSREQSLAITKLEEAMFWANAAIARSELPPEAG